MFGAALVEHDERYARSREFIDVLKGAWSGEPFHAGRHYSVDNLQLEPRPVTPALEIFQGGQSRPPAIWLPHSDWMFLNGGPPEKIAPIVADVRERASHRPRHPLRPLRHPALPRPTRKPRRRLLR